MIKKIYKLNLILEIICLILYLIFFYKIFIIKIIPIKYLIILLSIITLIIIIINCLNKIKNKLSRIITLILLIFLISIILLGTSYFNNTIKFMNNIEVNRIQIEEYFVLVRTETSYENLEDIKNLSIATYPSTAKNYQKNYKNLKVKTNEIFFSNYQDAYTALLNGEVESLFISYIEKLLLEEDKELYDKIRILQKEEERTELNLENINNSEKNFNIYISGIDIYGNISSVSRSDVNMIVTINTMTNQILLTSIPRDYYVQVYGTTGIKDKLTHAGLYGIDTSIKTLENLLNINIDYYIKINFTTVIDLINEIGGIDVYVDRNFQAWTNSKCNYHVGNMHLDGKCALAYARERYAYQEGDRHRVKNQQDILKATLIKISNSKTLIMKYNQILDKFQNNIETNIPSQKIYQLINNQLENMPSWNIEQISLNGFDSSNYTYSYPNQLLYVMEPNQSTVLEATTKIKNTLSTTK